MRFSETQAALVGFLFGIGSVMLFDILLHAL